MRHFSSPMQQEIGETLNVLEQDLEDFRGYFSQLELSRIEAEKYYDELEAELKNLKGHKYDLEFEVKRFRDLDNVRFGYEEIVRRSEEIEAERIDSGEVLRREVEKCEALGSKVNLSDIKILELNEEYEDFDTKLLEWDEFKERAADKLRDLYDVREGRIAELSGLARAGKELEAMILEKEEEREQMIDQIEAYKREMNNSQKSVDAFKTKDKKILVLYREVEKVHNELLREIAGLQKKRETQLVEIQKLKYELDELNEQIRQKEFQYSASIEQQEQYDMDKTNEIEELLMEIKHRETRIDDLTRSNSSANMGTEELISLQKSIDDLSEHNAGLRVAIGKLQEELSENKRFQFDMGQLQEGSQQLGWRLNESARIYDELRVEEKKIDEDKKLIEELVNKRFKKLNEMDLTIASLTQIAKELTLERDNLIEEQKQDKGEKKPPVDSKDLISKQISSLTQTTAKVDDDIYLLSKDIDSLKSKKYELQSQLSYYENVADENEQLEQILNELAEQYTEMMEESSSSESSSDKLKKMSISKSSKSSSSSSDKKIQKVQKMSLSSSSSDKTKQKVKKMSVSSSSSSDKTKSQTKPEKLAKKKSSSSSSDKTEKGTGKVENKTGDSKGAQKDVVSKSAKKSSSSSSDKTKKSKTELATKKKSSSSSSDKAKTSKAEKAVKKKSSSSSSDKTKKSKTEKATKKKSSSSSSDKEKSSKTEKAKDKSSSSSDKTKKGKTEKVAKKKSSSSSSDKDKSIKTEKAKDKSSSSSDKTKKGKTELATKKKSSSSSSDKTKTSKTEKATKKKSSSSSSDKTKTSKAEKEAKKKSSSSSSEKSKQSKTEKVSKKKSSSSSSDKTKTSKAEKAAKKKSSSSSSDKTEKSKTEKAAKKKSSSSSSDKEKSSKTEKQVSSTKNDTTVEKESEKKIEQIKDASIISKMKVDSSSGDSSDKPSKNEKAKAKSGKDEKMNVDTSSDSGSKKSKKKSSSSDSNEKKQASTKVEKNVEAKGEKVEKTDKAQTTKTNTDSSDDTFNKKEKSTSSESISYQSDSESSEDLENDTFMGQKDEREDLIYRYENWIAEFDSTIEELNYQKNTALKNRKPKPAQNNALSMEREKLLLEIKELEKLENELLGKIEESKYHSGPVYRTNVLPMIEEPRDDDNIDVFDLTLRNAVLEQHLGQFAMLESRDKEEYLDSVYSKIPKTEIKKAVPAYGDRRAMTGHSKKKRKRLFENEESTRPKKKQRRERD